MKRALLTAAVLLAALSQARADYVIIIANLGQSKPAPGGAMGAGGALGIGGAIGAGGAAGAIGLGGAAGALGGPLAGGAAGAGGALGIGGAAGAGGALGIGGAAGAGGALGIGGAAGAGGALGAGGAIGVGGAAGRAGNAGAAGALGLMGGAPGGIGAAGLMGAMGGPQDGPGNAGAFGGIFGNIGGQPDKGPPPIRVMAVIETRNPVRVQVLGAKDGKQPDKNSKPAPIIYTHHNWGESWLWGIDPIDVVVLTSGRKALPSVAIRFEEFKKYLVSKVKEPKAQEYLTLAEWALTHGLIGEFEKTMQELVDADKDKVNSSASAFTKVKNDLKALPAGESASRWKQTLFRNFKTASNEYYTLLHKSREDSQEVVSRLKHLKDNFVAFYYWHALKGKPLPMPKEKLVCVMAPPDESGNSFNRQHGLFDGVAITADSFYSPRYNLVVFSSRRSDRLYKGLSKSTESLWTHFNRDDILTKKGARVPDKERGKVTQGHLILAQTYSVFLHALEEDCERASVSHSGTRQILVASGLLPRSVDLPQWMQSGTGSFMQTPYGSPWRTYGAPHWSYLLSFRELKKDNKLPNSNDQLLRSVISDRFFAEGDKKEPSVKARSTAWALTYFLAQKRLDGLQLYFKELSRLPRDLPLDSDALLNCFARALGCVDATNKRDDQKLAALADAWMSYMEDEVKLDAEAQDILKKIHEMQNELAEDAKAGN